MGVSGSEELFPQMSLVDILGIKNKYEERRNHDGDEPGLEEFSEENYRKRTRDLSLDSEHHNAVMRLN